MCEEKGNSSNACGGARDNIDCSDSHLGAWELGNKRLWQAKPAHPCPVKLALGGVHHLATLLSPLSHNSQSWFRWPVCCAQESPSIASGVGHRPVQSNGVGLCFPCCPTILCHAPQTWPGPMHRYELLSVNDHNAIVYKGKNRRLGSHSKDVHK